MTGPRPPRQMALPLEYRTATGRADFLVSYCNHHALAAIEGWRDWPRGALALSGPARAGKSHLVAVWQRLTGARVVPAAEIARDPAAPSGALAVEDVPRIAGDRAAETALFHRVNAMAAEGHPLLVTGREPPSDWGIVLPDLASRLAALPLARIAEPDDALLAGVMVKLAADRRLALDPAVPGYCLARMERSFAAAERMVRELDRASLATRRRATPRLAAQILGSQAP